MARPSCRRPSLHLRKASSWQPLPCHTSFSPPFAKPGKHYCRLSGVHACPIRKYDANGVSQQSLQKGWEGRCSSCANLHGSCHLQSCTVLDVTTETVPSAYCGLYRSCTHSTTSADLGTLLWNVIYVRGSCLEGCLSVQLQPALGMQLLSASIMDTRTLSS